MKKMVLAALGATLIAGFAIDGASAAQRKSQPATVQAPVRADDGFRNSYNAYDKGYSDPRRLDGLAAGGAISAPAGR